jgi:SAM-dependent methyltransferase
MIRCPGCGALHGAPTGPGADEPAPRCPRCGFEPAVVDGFQAWAPELARASDGFRPEYFAQLAALEAGNFWFRARNRLLEWATARYFPDAHRYLEIGCGTGFVLQALGARFPALSMTASEVFVDGLPFAASRVPRARLLQMDARRLPFVEHFDLIGAYDVLEHIDEDETVLAAMHDALRPGGGVLLTVPQHPALWSEADRYACHVRRYRVGELEGKLLRAGFRLLRSTSFVSVLLPLLAMSRRRGQRQASFDPLSEFRIPRLADRALEGMLHAERAAIRLGLDLPAGGSRLVAATRIAPSPHRTRRG